MDNLSYDRQITEYAKEQIRIKLQKQGKITEDIKHIYVIYARKSTKGKRKDKKGQLIERQERSIEDQIDACQTLAKSLNITPLKIFKEKASAKISGNRDVFRQMMDGIKKKMFNSIISWHPDRLARNMKEGGEIIDLLDRGMIVDLKFPQYTFVRDSNGVMTLGIQFVLAKQYSDNLSTNTQRGSRNLAKEGKAPTNIPKRGYLLKNRYFRPDGDSFVLLRQAFEMALDGVPLQTIAEFLNKKNFSFMEKRLHVRKQILSDIFADSFYAGYYVFGTEVVELRKIDPEFEPLISTLQFMQLRNQYKEEKGFKPQRTKVVLFRDMVHCNYCKSLMTPYTPKSSGKGQRRYLRIICTNNNCITKVDKSLKRDFRSKILFEYIEQVLRQGFSIDRASYNRYIEELKLASKIYIKDFLEEIKNIERFISEYEITLEEKKKALGNAKGVTVDELNNEIDGLREKISHLKEKRKKLMEDVTSLDAKIEKQNTYEKFLNFFNNLVLIIRNSDNQYLVDNLIKMVFLNFIVEGGKVLSHQYNPEFEKYVKVKPVILSRDGGT